jgi:hypothetical protein
MFLRDGMFDGPGGRIGICGTRKDHRRIYYCGRCINSSTKKEPILMENKK